MRLEMGGKMCGRSITRRRRSQRGSACGEVTRGCFCSRGRRRRRICRHFAKSGRVSSRIILSRRWRRWRHAEACPTAHSPQAKRKDCGNKQANADGGGFGDAIGGKRCMWLIGRGGEGAVDLEIIVGVDPSIIIQIAIPVAG